MAAALGTGAGEHVPLPLPRLAVMAAIAVGSIGLSTAVTLPALGASLRPAELRFE